MSELAFGFLVILFYIVFFTLVSDFPWMCLCCAGGAFVKGQIGIAIFWVFLYFMLDK